MSGRADFLDLGDWNAQCFRCGRKRKAGELVKQWQGYYVCPEHWEPRQPQDFVRGIPDNPSVPWSQPDNWTFVGPNIALCTITGKSAVVGLAVVDCSIVDTPNTGLFANG